jgi:FtsZ-interacting cell division protein YlmF
MYDNIMNTVNSLADMAPSEDDNKEEAKQQEAPKEQPKAPKAQPETPGGTETQTAQATNTQVPLPKEQPK